MSRKTYPNGTRFGRLTIMSRQGIKRICLCDCGKQTVCEITNLVKGSTKSCGCLRSEEVAKRMLTHGSARRGRNTQGYRVWAWMINRCRNPNCKEWPNYGGRGIVVCEEWKSFKNFIADMGEPGGGLTIERKDNNGPYCKNNCVWATRREQNNNSRHNHRITHDGDAKTVTEWARSLGISHSTIINRLKRGMSVADALSTRGLRGRRSKTVV
jgi:hypothetical protein